MKSLESWILSYLLNSLWQVPLLFAAGWVAARVLRPAGVRAEHRVWVSVLLLQSVLPACSTLPLGWLRTLVAGSVLPANGTYVTVTRGPDAGLSAGHLPTWFLAAIAIAYGAGCAYFVARLVWCWRRLRTIRTEAVEVMLSRGAADCLTECSLRFGIEGASIAASSRISGPVTMGFSRKLILLPVDMASSLPESEIRAVIAHEFAHIRRNDFLKNVIYEVLALPVSYHPLFWFTRERVTESREIVCDEIAAGISGRRQYARSLLRLASLLVEGMPVRTPHAIGIFDANTFERRVMKLSEKRIQIGGMRRTAIVIACAAFGVATCGSALALGMHVDAATASSASQGTKPSHQNNVPAGVMRVGNGVSAPVLIYSVDPKYSSKARRAKYQGVCVLALIVDKNGKPQNIHVARKLGMGLDEKAVEAVRQYRFKPAYYKGHPVPVQI
ncbi:MAG: M56 family metallopeptidase, partial [Acidobacteriaceae bacterium]